MWNIIGQDKAVTLLQRSIEQNKLAHAYLFVGPSGVGKARLAVNIAQALNCESDQPPCGNCEVCLKIESGKHADVQVIGIANNGTPNENKSRTEISIDQIRQMQHAASLPPFEGKYRVYIIDGAEQMSTEASNCLLKTLEEPSESVVFVLLTTNEKLMLETVISRCQRIELPPLDGDEIEQALVNNLNIDQHKAHLLSRLCRGSIGWAIDALNNEHVIRQREEQLRRIFEVLDADFEYRFAYAAEVATQFSRDRSAVFKLLSLWKELFHDIIRVKTDISFAVENIDVLEIITGVAGKLSLKQARDIIAAIEASCQQLKLNANPQLALEVLMLSIPRNEQAKKIFN